MQGKLNISLEFFFIKATAHKSVIIKTGYVRSLLYDLTGLVNEMMQKNITCSSEHMRL